MLIRAYSDLHGRLPAIAPCDALLIAGDICPIVGGHAPATQAEYLSGIFRQWCEALPAEQIVLIPGNHDFAIESLKAGADYELAENVTLLIDQGVELGGGPKVFGQPWVPDLVAWAFYATDQKLAEKAAAIPDGYDIWLQHGPPACSEGIEEYRLDLVNPQHVGNRSLEAAIRKKQPQAVICGHIHEGFGGARFGESLVANVSFLDEFYETQWRHLELEWNDGEAVRTELVIEGDGQLAWDCIAAAGEL